jgi:hypothetical protein
MGEPAVVTAITDIAVRFAQRRELDQSTAIMRIADELGAAGVQPASTLARAMLTDAEAGLVHADPTGRSWWHPEACRLLELCGADPQEARDQARR